MIRCSGRLSNGCAFVLLRAHQLSGDFKRPAGVTGELYDDFMKACATNPVCKNVIGLASLLSAPDKLRKGMALR